MSEDNSGSGKPLKNSLLSAAATGFSFEDAATLVPVNLQDEPESGVEAATSEIDLNSEDQEDLPSVESLEAVANVATESCPHISLFSNSALDDDAFSLLLSSPNKPLEPVVLPDGLKSSKSSDKIFSLSSLWPRNASPTTENMSNQPSASDQQSAPPVPSEFISHYTPPGTNAGFPVMGSSQPPIMTPNVQLNDKLHTGTYQAPPYTLPPTSAPMSGPSSKGNSFRLGSHKPVYAQYPGLMGSTPQSTQFPPVPMQTISLPNDQPSVQSSLITNVNLPIAPFTAPLPIAPPTSSYFQNSNSSTVPTNFDLREMQNTVNLSASSIPAPHLKSPITHPTVYNQLTFHWFYKKEIDGRALWKPFSMLDSVALDDAFTLRQEECVSTDGGRYDVNVNKRQKVPIYWEEDPTEVRRCSWFYKGPMDSRFVPYEEELSERLENEYHQAMTTGFWHRRLEFPGGEAIILHNPNAMSHFCKAAAPDEWGNLPESQLRPRVVKRGVDEFEIEDGESTQIDHLVFLVHGIGAICDFKFRSIEEAVDDFRHLSFQLMHSHFKDAVDSKKAGRIEFLPVSWHKALHGDGGIDQKLKPITLKSIPKLRNFTNDTLLDILFYTSPVYAQTIVDTVGKELNRLFNLFLSRNPTFNGKVALSGHSLGSLILFDLLAHQPQTGRQPEPEVSEDKISQEEEIKVQVKSSDTIKLTETESRMVSYRVGSGTGQPFISYPTLQFEPTAFFAMGSPIAMFVTVRGIDGLGENFHFPTCPAFFNIFHPFDPVAYRIETLIEPSYDQRPVLIPHHKGRKRFHLELKETMQRVGADLKQKFLDSLKTTWNTVYQYATFSKGENFEQEIERVIEGELVKKSVDTASNGSAEDLDQDVGLGKLNGGRRIDYVLQEAPLESFNEYLFALSSHVCYWESEDTMLMIMREIYASMGIFSETKAPPQPQLQYTSTAPTPNQYLMDSSNQNYNFPPALSPNSQPFVINGSSNWNSFGGHTSTSPTYLTPQQTYPTSSNVENAPPPPLFMNPDAAATGSNNSQSWTSNPPMFPMSTSVGPSVGTGKPTIIGARPVVSPEALASLRGMDPTAPIASQASIGPPPLQGFTRKQ